MKSALDLTIFKQIDSTCQGFAKCSALDRLSICLKYYQILRIRKYPKNRQVLVSFIQDIYPQILDDYDHIIDTHGDNLEEIKQELINHKQIFQNCDLNSCSFTASHYRSSNNEHFENGAFDPILSFYVNTLDSVHFYLFHCVDAGLRSSKRQNVTNEERKQDVYENGSKNKEFYDAEFSRLKMEVSAKHRFTKTFERFSTKNNKFTITEHVKNDNVYDDTILDELRMYLIEKGVDSIYIRQLFAFLDGQQYDSDAFEYECNIAEGNISKHISDEHCSQFLIQFVQAWKCSGSGFSVGLRFYYWPCYKSITNVTHASIKEEYISGESGYSISDLYVKPKYESMKVEVLNYEYFNIEQYKETVTKTKQYQKTERAKSIQAKDLYTPDYGIAQGSHVTFNHLLSVILYCDYTQLSTDFSSTFRKTRLFESLENIKKRNMNYFWMSKSLREMVEVFGECSSGDSAVLISKGVWKWNRLSGPFYSGLSATMSIPEFSMRACGPVSTSKQITVAMRFAGISGIVITLNNPSGNSRYSHLRVLNCSWISRFKAEDERLLFGGHHRVKIEGLLLMKSKQNLAVVANSLWYFDLLITGERLEGLKIHKTERITINNLFKNNQIFDGYVNAMFKAFVAHKQQMFLRFEELKTADNGFRNLIMHSLDERTANNKQQRSDKDLSNLLRLEIFNMFTNVKTVIIKTTSGCGWYVWSFSMMGLLNTISQTCIHRFIVKSVEHYKGYNWIKSVWDTSSKTLKNEYAAKQYSISMREAKQSTKPYRPYNEYWFVINKNTQ